MSDGTVNPSGAMDSVKWVIAVLFLGAAVGGNFYFGEMSVLYRALGVVAAIIIAMVIASTTTKGTEFVSFAKDSRTEVRKVVWPSRQEATQTTAIVLIATLIMALLLWGLDGIIVRVVGFLTGIEV